MNDKIKYFLDAWEMNGIGKTVATVQDGPGTVVTLTVDDLRAIAASASAEPVASIFANAAKRCDMGVGCDEAGVCYAEAHGEPDRCSKSDRPVMRFNIIGNLINPDPNGMFVRYEDHARFSAPRPIEAPDNSQPVIADTAGAKPIYQVLEPCEAVWSDTDWLTYESTDGAFKRIVYAAPPAPSVADAAPAIEAPAQAVALSTEHRANIEAAIKETEYKYFGMYEFTEAQHSAVDLLVSVAQAMLDADPAALSAPTSMSAEPKREFDTEAFLKATMGDKYSAPTNAPDYSWLSPTSADRADLEAQDDVRDAQTLPENIDWTRVMAMAEEHGDGWSDEKGWSFHCDDDLFNFASAIAAQSAKEQ